MTLFMLYTLFTLLYFESQEGGLGTAQCLRIISFLLIEPVAAFI